MGRLEEAPVNRLKLLMVVLPCLAFGCGETAAKRPNILLIVADDMGYTDVGFLGGEIATPNLDELALGGLRFTNFHAGSSCSPTRAMLISGVTNREVGIAGPASVLPDTVAPLPALIRDAGYHTYMTGKWHLGHERQHSPAARGFDASYALVRAGDNHLGRSNYPDEDVAYRENGEAIQELPAGWFSSELYTNKLLEYIQANEGDGVPWFGYLAFTAPHWPLQLPEDWIDRYGGRYDDGYDVVRAQRMARAVELGVLPEAIDPRAYEGIAPAWDELDEDSKRTLTRSMEIYAAMVENMDFHVGRVLDYLRQSGQLEDTVIVFFSDNGASGSDASFRPVTLPRTDWDSTLPNMGREGSFVAIGRGWAEAATAPYRAVKGSLHEGGTLAAAFVSHASVAQAGGFARDYVTVMDVMPTLLGIAETTHPGTEYQGRPVLPIRGRSFWPRVMGDTAPVHLDSDVVPWMSSDRRGALVRGGFKVQKDEADPTVWRLYDLNRDPGETTDVSQEHAELKQELIVLFNAYVDAL
jgi:arylsulfatase A-like enzyme